MAVSLEKRISVLEQQVAQLLGGTESKAPSGREWVDDLYGEFAGDPIFARAMKLGRQFRKSLRPRLDRSKPKRAR